MACIIMENNKCQYYVMFGKLLNWYSTGIMSNIPIVALDTLNTTTTKMPQKNLKIRNILNKISK